MSVPAAAVEEVKLTDTQYTLEHMRAFGMYNYLHIDPWYEDSVLFVDCKGRVLSLTVTLVSFSSHTFFRCAAAARLLPSHLSEVIVGALVGFNAPDAPVGGDQTQQQKYLLIDFWQVMSREKDKKNISDVLCLILKSLSS